MRRALEQDDLLDEEPASRDLVLGLPALLGIFFSLAVVCAVCFGFGYSSAHRLHAPAASSVASNTPGPLRGGPAHPVPLGGSGAEAEAENEVPAEATGSAGKPLPGAGAAGIGTESGMGSAPAGEPSAPGQAVPAPGGREAEGFPPNYVVPETGRPPAAPAPQRAGIQAEGTSLMVQIAAVSRAADAETLASALRHDGFAAMVRTSTSDNYFHIQVGPFATLDAAKAMRARLADTGYNAFIKP